MPQNLTNGSSQSCRLFESLAGLTQQVQEPSRKIFKTRHMSELIVREGDRFYRREIKQTECFLSQSWPSFWPFFSS